MRCRRPKGEVRNKRGIRGERLSTFLGQLKHYRLRDLRPWLYSMAGYYHQEDLARFAEIGKDAPELWKKFSEWYGAVFAEGALTEREKCLIALAVAHAVQCPYCIDAYTQASLEKGSNLEQMSEAVHVAAAIRGGASLVHGVQMRNCAAKISM